MTRLLHDRYFLFDATRGCDLVTGEEVALDGMSAANFQPALRTNVQHGETACSQELGVGTAKRIGSWELPLRELFDHGRDGEPRWIVAEARNGTQAAAIARRAAAEGRRSGFVAVSVEMYLRLREMLADDLAERTLLLIGGFAATIPAARAALVEAAAAAPRPHVLLTFRSAGGSAGGAALVREARAVYGAPGGRAPAVHLPGASDLMRYAGHMTKAAAFVREGRHAAAERLLRETAGALTRRRAFSAAAESTTALGCLLLERGRAGDADIAFGDAARHAHAAQNEPSMLAARIWQAAARCDIARFTEAEALCRATLMTGSLSPARSTWARAELGRALLWQERPDIDLQLLALDRAAREELGAVTAAFVDGVAVRMSLANGRMFEAGQRARIAVDAADASGDPLARAIAHTAHLRILAEGGDLTSAAAAFSAIRDAARRAHTPLRVARARVVWHDALSRGGQEREAARELARLARLGAAAPPALRRAIERRAAGRVPPRAIGASQHPHAVPVHASTLVRVANDEDDDAAAVRGVMERVARELQTSRSDLLSCDAGPATTLLTSGSGLATHLGGRVLEAGISIGPELHAGGHEIGVPVRVGTRLLAALVARWPLDRMPPAHAPELLQLSAAVIGPRVEQQLAAARSLAAASTSVPELVGVSAAMADVRRAILRAAGAPFNVLIEGESGTGKELAARAIHQLSPRRERRFCDVNCAAIPEELLDSELFGHARGAFTGAVTDKAGLFEDASGGTLFLDEVADLSPRGQAKLLRVLQQHEVRRVGETFSRTVDVRLVTAANRDMRRDAADGRFRQDLLYRLDVIRIHIPPLRDRPEDIALLAEHFWRAAASRIGSSARLAHGVLAALTRYHWPGNVREVQNVMAALAVAAPARGRVHAALLPAAIAGASGVTSPKLAEARLQFERRCIEVALARAGGNRTQAAAQLGLTRQGLLKTMARVGLEAK